MRTTEDSAGVLDAIKVSKHAGDRFLTATGVDQRRYRSPRRAPVRR